MQEDRTPAIEAKMMALLELVGIQYLVERWSGTIPLSWGGGDRGSVRTRKGAKTVADESGTPWHSGLDHVTRSVCPPFHPRHLAIAPPVLVFRLICCSAAQVGRRALVG